MVMVGDGINDVFVLVIVDFGIVMGGVGIDMVMEIVDIVFMVDNLEKFFYMMKLSCKVLVVIK